MRIKLQETVTRTSLLIRFSLTHPLASSASGALHFVPRIRWFFLGGKSSIKSLLSVKKQLIVVSLPDKNMFSVRGAASPTPCYNTHTQIMNNAHHKNESAALDDLCRVCGCKLHRGIKAKGRAVKPEPPYSCISYADKLLVAFNINILV